MEIIPLDAIILNGKVWPRMKLDLERVGEFIELYKEKDCPLPPLEVVPNDDVSTFTLTDGWHRYHALQELGQAAPCIILPKGTDAYLHALERSAIGQKPLTRIEKQKSVVRMIAEYPSKSDREVARLCGVSHTMVASTRDNPSRQSAIKKEKDGRGNSATTHYVPPSPQLSPHQEFIVALKVFLEAYPTPAKQAQCLIQDGYIMSNGMIRPYSPLANLLEAIRVAQHQMQGS